MNRVSRWRHALSLQRWSDREAARIKQSFLDPGRASPVSQMPAWRSAIALILAGLVLSSALLVFLLGLWSCSMAIRALKVNPIQVTVWSSLAVLCLLGSWLARPRFPVLEDQLLTPVQAPELHALIGEIAGLLNAPVPQILRINGNVNAFVTREGFPPRFSLTLGLPLLFGFHPQELVNLLAHELAHEVNGDPLRGQWLAAALNVLHTVQHLLAPARLGSGSADALANGVRWVLVLPVHGLIWVLYALLGEDSQRAEYRADLMAASVSGSEAAVIGLSKLHFGDLLEFALQKQRSNPERPHAFLELRHAWDHLTPEQRARRGQQMAQHRLRLDQSHPPTVDRTEVVARHHLPVALRLSPERASRIEAELTPFVTRIQTEVYDHFRDLYSDG